MTSQHMGPAAPGKRLYFAEVDKPKPPSKLSHALQQAPGLMVSGAVHREVQQAEQDNVGLESVHKLELGAETAGRIAESAYHAHKLRPYRQAARAERRLEIYYFKTAARLLVFCLGVLIPAAKTTVFLFTVWRQF